MNYRNRQQGVVLVIAMIALVAISLAGVALMRTVDTSNVVSGNIAFNEAAIQIADIGAELAYKQVNANLYYDHTTHADGSLVEYHNDTANPGNITGYVLNPNTGCEPTSCPAYYYMTLQNNPAGLAWYSVQANQITPALPSGYSLQYRIERMCAQAGQATFKDASGNQNCRALPIYTAGILQANPLVDPTTGIQSFVGKLFYRITVKVTGPKDTTAQAQYFYGIQDYIQ